jgi:hypothetical protein
MAFCADASDKTVSSPVLESRLPRLTTRLRLFREDLGIGLIQSKGRATQTEDRVLGHEAGHRFEADPRSATLFFVGF